MGLTTLLGTLLGAAIAMSTSLAVQVRKDRSDVAADWRRTRRDMYLAFITSLAQARNALLALSKQSGNTDAELDEARAGCPRPATSRASTWSSSRRRT